MPRLDNKRYEQQVMLTMLAYMVVLFAVGPLMHATASLALKAVLAVLPALPILYIIVLMWRRIRDSDELEQRTHLVALGVAVAVVSAASVVVGFLAGGGVVHLGGSVLIWVFPALMACYGTAQRWVARRYGMGDACAEQGSPWLSWYFGAMGVAFLAFALYLWSRREAGSALWMAGTAVFFLGLGGWVGWRRAHAQRRLREEQP